MTSVPDVWPAPDELADDQDELGWDVGRDGRMREFAAPDDTVPTAPYVDSLDA